MSNEAMETAIARSEIIEVAFRSWMYRDRGDWEPLLACFHPDAHIVNSWFEGNAHEFIEGSRAMMEGHDPTDTQKHFTGNRKVDVQGDRAVCEYYLTLHQRRRIDGHLFDLQTWSCVLDMFARRDGEWRVFGRWTIYEKDRLDPHKPDEIPASFFADMDLSPYPDAMKYHCWRNDRYSGRMPADNIVIEGTARAQETRTAANTWLDGGAVPWETVTS